MGTVLKVIIGLVGLFFLAVLGLQLFGGLMMANVAWTVSESMKPETAASPFGNNVELTGIYDGDMQKRGYLALASFDEFHQYRYVRVDTTVTAKSLLATGETLPEPDLLEVFASARATKVADAECELLKQMLAKDCRVSYVSGKLEDGRRVSISMVLEFTQKTAFGVLKNTKKAAYADISQSLTDNNQTIKSTVEGLPALRRTFYTRAERICERVRRTEGNCAITDMSIRDFRESDSNSLVRVQAQMRLAVVTAL